MLKMLFKLVLLTCIATSSPWADVMLTVVSGEASHSSKDAAPPLTKDDLVLMAMEDAFKRLGDALDFMQVSKWEIAIECRPVYRGSLDCYEGKAKVTASFIKIEHGREVRTVEASGRTHWHRQTEAYDATKALARAKQQAYERARFLCNGDAKSPTSVRAWTDAATIEWQCMDSHYTAVFQCVI